MIHRLPIERACLLTGSLLACVPLVAQQRPHIILLMADQHRFDALGCMGNDAVQTPNLDALASDGTTFMHAYSSTPSSTPARAGLLTGLSPWHHGMLGYGRVGGEYRFEMPRMLRQLGYYTFGVGKMHWFPQHALHGFHATLVDESGRVESPDFISDYRRWFQLHAPGQDPDKTGIGWNDLRAGTYQLPEELHPTAWTGETACELIRNYDDERPLFLKVSFARPHSPYDPPQRFIDLYDGQEIPAPYAGDWAEAHATLKEPTPEATRKPYGNYGDEYACNSRRHYYANVTFVDEEIGKVVAALREKGMYDNALIVYVSDHGDMLGDHYHWRKTYPYEGSAHIPFIVKWPASVQAQAGGKDVHPVELRDLLPTFLDAAGGTVPDGMDGRSLLPLVTGNSNVSWRDYIDLEHSACYAFENYWCALTDGRIKYVWNFYDGHEELFDLSQDPCELKELSGNPAYHDVLVAMRRRMVGHLSERGEGFVKDGRLVVRGKDALLYSPFYPGAAE